MEDLVRLLKWTSNHQKIALQRKLAKKQTITKRKVTCPSK